MLCNMENDCLLPSNTFKCVSDQLNVQEDGLVTSSPSESVSGKTVSHWVLLIFSGLAVLIGTSSGVILGRLYFVHGGSSRWIYAWNETVGFPIVLVALIVGYWKNSAFPTRLTFKLFAIYMGLSFLLVIDNLLYAWGLSYVPVSTSSLLFSSQLAFSALFSYFLLKRSFTPFILNSVVVITMGAVLLGIHSNSDRPAGTTKKQYIVGFVLTIAAAVIFALMVTLLEMFYKSVMAKNSLILMLETQFYVNGLGTIFIMVCMWIVSDYQAIQEEARIFDLGSSAYALVLVWSAVSWQLCFLGTVGVIFLASSLTYSVLLTACLPVVPILAVFFFHDSFSAVKAMSMLLTIWGFASYSYGGYLESKFDPPHH
eukprot:c13088_g1_i1 orf=558-1664(+)